jgi:predicted CoA-substrate-specific enzyme activase
MIVAGIDIGAISTKTVILNNNQFSGWNIIETGLHPRKAAVTSLQESLKQANLAYEQLNHIVATGHGRKTIDFATTVKTEIMACAKGAKQILSTTRIILDLGGQGIRIILMDPNGVVENFVTNDKCSSGTGCFLDAMAFALGVDLKQLGQLAETAQRAETISTKCTIFAESEVISLVARGKNMEDIVAGLHDSVAKKVASLTKPLMPSNLGPNTIFVAGGVAKNKGVVNALTTALNMQLFTPNDPQVITAYGAALLAPTTPAPTPLKPLNPEVVQPAQAALPVKQRAASPSPTPAPTPTPTPTPAPTPTPNPTPNTNTSNSNTGGATGW